MLPVFAIGVCVLHYGICLIRRSFQPLIPVTHKEDSTESTETNSSAPEIMKVVPRSYFHLQNQLHFVFMFKTRVLKVFVETSFLASGLWLWFRR